MYVLTTTHLLLFYLLYHVIMENSKASFIIRKKYRKQIELLDNEKAWMLFKAIMKMQDWEVLENTDPVISMLLSVMEEERKTDDKKYKEVCEKNRENIKKRRANKKVNDSIQNDTTVYDRIPTDTKNTDNDNDIWYINILKENELREDWKRCYYWNVWLKDTELERLNKEYWSNVIEEYIIRLSEYIDKKWDSYTDHNKTIRKRLAKWNVKKKSERIEEWDKPHDFSKDNVIYPVRKRAWEIQK